MTKRAHIIDLLQEHPQAVDEHIGLLAGSCREYVRQVREMLDLPSRMSEKNRQRRGPVVDLLNVLPRLTDKEIAKRLAGHCSVDFIRDVRREMGMPVAGKLAEFAKRQCRICGEEFDPATKTAAMRRANRMVCLHCERTRQLKRHRIQIARMKATDQDAYRAKLRQYNATQRERKAREGVEQ